MHSHISNGDMEALRPVAVATSVPRWTHYRRRGATPWWSHPIVVVNLVPLERLSNDCRGNVCMEIWRTSPAEAQWAHCRLRNQRCRPLRLMVAALGRRIAPGTGPGPAQGRRCGRRTAPTAGCGRHGDLRGPPAAPRRPPPPTGSVAPPPRGCPSVSLQAPAPQSGATLRRHAGPRCGLTALNAQSQRACRQCLASRNTTPHQPSAAQIT